MNIGEPHPILEYANPLEDVQPPDVTVAESTDGALTLNAPCPGRIVAILAGAACFGGAVVMGLLIAFVFEQHRDADRVVGAATLGPLGVFFGTLFMRMALRPVVFVVTPTSIEVRGGALLRGLDLVIQNASGLEVKIADDPLTCVARGTATFLENLEIWKDTLESDMDM